MRSVVLAAVAILMFGVGTANAGWTLIEKKDVMTDAVTKEVCSQDTDANEVCFYFADGMRDGKKGADLWMSFRVVNGQGRALVFEKYPMTRIDSNEAHDINPLIEIEKMVKMKMLPREFHAEWAAWAVQTFENKAQFSNASGMYHQLANGQMLRIRAFLAGGFQKDSSVSLDGIAPHLASLAPPLN